jgi:DNA replication protein DnaC
LIDAIRKCKVLYITESSGKAPPCRDRYIFVKLDKDGGVLLDPQEKVHPIALAEKEKGEWAGVSAGDVLISEIAFKLAAASRPSIAIGADVIVKLCQEAVQEATAYCATAENIDHDNWYGRIFDMPNNRAEDVRLILPKDQATLSKSLSEFEERAKKAEKLHTRLNKLEQLEMHMGEWYIDGFVTTDKKFGVEIETLRSKIAAYVESVDYERKPFVGAICGPPGSGKSKLAEALADALGCKYIPENVAQWKNLDDLSHMCERIRTEQIRSRPKPPLVFLDEVDSLVESQPVYGKLLAPLWDNLYSVHGEKRNLGLIKRRIGQRNSVILFPALQYLQSKYLT